MHKPDGAFRYNSPPNWPAPPAPDWAPMDGWEPLAEWGPAPEGWVFWLPTSDAEVEGGGKRQRKSWDARRQEQVDKRAAKGKPPLKSFAEIRAEQREASAEQREASAEKRAASAPPPSSVGSAHAGWWSSVGKATVAVNVRYLNVKTMTKSMGMGTLKLNPEEGITWRANLGPKVVIPWASIETIDIDGESTSRMTLTRVVTVGVFALGAKKKKTDTTMVIVTPTKEFSFEFEKTQPTVVRNKMRPVLSALSAASATAIEAPMAVAPSSAVGVPEQIQQLAALRDQGILTVEEFDSKKAELLARM